MRRTHASILPLHGISTSALLTPSFRISLGFKHTMNSILYIGLAIMFGGFLLFMYAVHSIAKYERKLWELKERNKYNVRF